MCGFAVRYPELKRSPLLPRQCWMVGRACTRILEADGHTAFQQNSQVQAWEAPSRGSKGLTNGVSTRYSSQWGKKNDLPLAGRDWSWIGEYTAWAGWDTRVQRKQHFPWWCGDIYLRGRVRGPPGLSGLEGICSGRPVWLRKCQVTADLGAGGGELRTCPFPCLEPVTGFSAFSTFPCGLEPGDF